MTILLLEKFGLPNLDITVTISNAQQLCADNATLDADCAKIITSLLTATQDAAKYTQEERDIYLELAKTSYLFMINASTSLISTRSPEEIIKQLENYIQNCQEDAANTTKLKNLFTRMLQQQTIELSFVATLLYTLEIKLSELMNLSNPINSDLRLYHDLIKLLTPCVMKPEDDSPEQKNLNQIYLKYKSHYNVIFSPDKIGKTARIIVPSCYYDLIKMLRNISQKCSKIKSLMQSQAEQLDQVTLTQTQEILIFPENMTLILQQENINFWNDLPNCYSLSLNNYLSYRMVSLYECGAWYKQLHEQLSTLKQQLSEKLAQELVSLNLEAQKLIEQAQITTKENKSKFTPKIADPLEQSYTYVFDPAINLKAKVKELKPKYLEYLLEIFNFKYGTTKIKLDYFKLILDLLGGKLETYQGSKTRIYIPFGISIAIAKIEQSHETLDESYHKEKAVLCGGLHKPHSKAADLGWIHARLIAKALNRAGITSKYISEILTNPERQKSQTTESSQLLQANSKSKVKQTLPSDRTSQNKFPRSKLKF